MSTQKSKLLCMVIDDERPALLLLASFINKVEELSLVACVSDASEAVDLLKKRRVDLLFLDINMPRMNGLGLLNSLDYKPMVIFTTAFSNYALQSFEYNVVDYLVKPITEELFQRAIDKVLERASHKGYKSMLEVEKENSSRLEVRVSGKLVAINYDDIIYLQSFGNYVKIFLHKNMLLASSTMQESMKKLPESKFLRIHKSFIVNRDYVKSIDHTMVEINNTFLPIGISYRQFVTALFNE